MALITHLDCSGDAVDPNTKTIAVGGFIAHEEQWVELEGRWQSVMDEFGVSALHMKDFAHSTKNSEFASWKGDEPKRRSFIQALTELIGRYTIQSVGATLFVSEYAAVNRTLLLRETLGAPYTLASMLVMGMTVDWHNRNKFNEELMFVFEKGDNEQLDFKDVLRRLTQWDLNLVVEPIFREKNWKDREGRMRHFIPFQVADFLCYEHAKAATDYLNGKRTRVRESLYRLMQHSKDERMWRPMPRAQLTVLCRRFNVQRRFNYALEPDLQGMMPSNPLCYVSMDRPMVSYSGGPELPGDTMVGGGPLPGLTMRTRFTART